MPLSLGRCHLEDRMSGPGRSLDPLDPSPQAPSCCVETPAREGRALVPAAQGSPGSQQGLSPSPTAESRRGLRPQESGTAAFSVAQESACLDRCDGGAGRWCQACRARTRPGRGVCRPARAALQAGPGVPGEACAAGAGGCGPDAVPMVQPPCGPGGRGSVAKSEPGAGGRGRRVSL